MKIKIWLPVFIGIVMLFSACTKTTSPSGQLTTDDELIQAIQDANNKELVSENHLPNDVRVELTTNYSKSYIDLAKLAPELGFEIDLRRLQGANTGEMYSVYFDTDGRKLGRDNEVEERFEFIYPLTFIMPDGTEIVINNDEDWYELREWYEANPDVEEEPELQFPLQIIVDGETIEINSYEELRGSFSN